MREVLFRFQSMGRRAGVHRRGRKKTPITERERYNQESVEQAVKSHAFTRLTGMMDSLKRQFVDISRNQWLECKDTGTIKGWGVFAVKPIRQNTWITPYRGVILTKDEYKKKMSKNPSMDYALRCPGDDDNFYVVDANPLVIKKFQVKDTDTPTQQERKIKKCPPLKEIGLAGFINHRCGSGANCRFEPRLDQESPFDRIWVKAIKYIPAGEELTIDYGFDLGEGEHSYENPAHVPEGAFRCDCGVLDCRHLDFTPFKNTYKKKRI